MNGEKYMEISEEHFELANRRAAAARAAFPAVVSVKYDRRIASLVIALSSGLELAFSPKSAQGLENAHPAELMDVEITPSGLGVHFPRLDADLYIPALLEGFLGSKRWMASLIGKTGGAASTEAKVAAARQNGKLGGRPKKSKGLITA
jgi:hypothetical protein